MSDPIPDAQSTSGAPAPERYLWDESARLSAEHRRDIERRLTAASRRLGSPVYVWVVDKLRHETAAAFATRTFAAHAFGSPPQSNPVLLVYSVRDQAAAIETGKGSAGIVPEIDARQITKRLISTEPAALSNPRALAKSLVLAIDAVVASAEATAARRQPLSADDETTAPASPLPSSSGLPAATETGFPSGTEPPDAGMGPGAATPTTETKRGRSRLPIAAAIGALVLLVLALRRRRMAITEAKDRPRTPPPPSRPKR